MKKVTAAVAAALIGAGAIIAAVIVRRKSAYNSGDGKHFSNTL